MEAVESKLKVMALAAASQPGVESPQKWLERVIRILEVAEGEEQLASRLAELAGALLGGRGLVLFFSGRGEVLELAELRSNPVSSTLVRLVRETGLPFHSPDVRFDPRLATSRSIRDVRRPSVICHPIRGSAGRLLGVVYVDELQVGCSEEPSTAQVVSRVAEMASALLEAFDRRRQLEQREETALSRFGTSRAMQRVARQIHLLSSSSTPDLTVLLTGETGVGKSFFARAIHEGSPWRSHPFYAVNCAAIPSELFESEMFGHRKGAFTSAFADRAGALELAGEGTLFLDEIGDISPGHQAKLLTALSERTFRRVGEEKPRPFHARLICATNRDLELMVRQGLFREDLLSRLMVNQCRIPPVRERGPDDLRLFIGQLLQLTLTQQGVRERGAPLPRVEDYLTPKAQQHVVEYPWPGNVRELENLFRNELIRQRLREKKRIDEKLLSDVLQGGQGVPASLEPRGSLPGQLFPAGLTFQELKTRCDAWMGDYIYEVVQAHAGDKNAAAGALKCARDSVYKYLSRRDGEG